MISSETAATPLQTQPANPENISQQQTASMIINNDEQTTTLHKLPREICTLICTFLRPRDYFALSLTCHFFKNLSEEKILIRQQILKLQPDFFNNYPQKETTRQTLFGLYKLFQCKMGARSITAMQQIHLLTQNNLRLLTTSIPNYRITFWGSHSNINIAFFAGLRLDIPSPTAIGCEFETQTRNGTKFSIYDNANEPYDRAISFSCAITSDVVVIAPATVSELLDIIEYHHTTISSTQVSSGKKFYCLYAEDTLDPAYAPTEIKAATAKIGIKALAISTHQNRVVLKEEMDSLLDSISSDLAERKAAVELADASRTASPMLAHCRIS